MITSILSYPMKYGNNIVPAFFTNEETAAEKQ